MSDTNPIEKGAEILTAAQEYIKELLQDNPSVLLQVDSTLIKLINKLNFMTGKQSVSQKGAEFPPITDFMGEKITYGKKLKQTDLTPLQADRQIYIEKVEQLYAVIETISPEGLLHSYTLPEDQVVIRGVAKRAGVEGYEVREINLDFIEDIAAAIKQKAAADAQQGEIDRKLQEDELAAKKAAADAQQGDTPDDEANEPPPASTPANGTGKKKTGNK